MPRNALPKEADVKDRTARPRARDPQFDPDHLLAPFALLVRVRLGTLVGGHRRGERGRSPRRPTGRGVARSLDLGPQPTAAPPPLRVQNLKTGFASS